MHRQAEVLGGEVGEPVRRGLVRDGVGVAQVLDRDVLGRLGLSQQVERAGLRDQQRGGEVVDLDPLLEELARSPAAPVAEHDVTERLQGQRPGIVLARVGLRQIDPRCARSVTVRVDSGRSDVWTSRKPEVSRPSGRRRSG